MSRRLSNPDVLNRCRFWLLWHRGQKQGDYLAHTAQPTEITRGGIILFVAGAPPALNQTVWISLGEESPELSLLLPAEVIEIKQETRTEFEIRLAFSGPCPEAMIKAAGRFLKKELATAR